MAAEWSKIKTEYITTDTSYRKLSEKYGIGYQAICHKSKAEGWIAMREQHRNRTTTKTLDRISDTQAQRAARLQTVADKLLGKIEAAVDSFDMEILFADRQALRQITGALKDIKDIQMIKSDADIREQEERIKKLRREAERDDEKNEVPTLDIVGLPEEFRV